MTRTLQKNIRVRPEQWECLEDAARERHTIANQLLLELAMEALDRREWPQTDLEILMMRSCVFAAQATARDMMAAGVPSRSFGAIGSRVWTAHETCHGLAEAAAHERDGRGTYGRLRAGGDVRPTDDVRSHSA